MRKHRTYLAILTTALFGAAALYGCSSDDANPADGGGGGGGGGATSDALGATFTQFFEGNAQTFTSLDYFTPLIEAAAGGPIFRQSGAAAGCINPALIGEVFQFNGQSYAIGGTGTPPTDGVRFLLYQVDDQGNPDMNNEIGYLDIWCSSTLPAVNLTISLVVGGRTVVGATITGNYYGTSGTLNYTGFVYDNNGTPLGVGGVFSFPYSSGYGIDNGLYVTVGIEVGPVSFGYGVNADPATDAGELFFSAVKVTTSIEWDVFGEMFADANGTVTSGYATYSDGFDYLTVACLGGTFAAPTITPATSGDCTREGSTAGTYPLGSLGDITATYQMMRSLHGAMRGLIGAVLSTVDQPTL